jgi:hypothetical protein
VFRVAASEGFCGPLTRSGRIRFGIGSVVRVAAHDEPDCPHRLVALVEQTVGASRVESDGIAGRQLPTPPILQANATPSVGTASATGTPRFFTVPMAADAGVYYLPSLTADLTVVSRGDLPVAGSYLTCSGE